MGLLELLGTLS